MSELLEGRQNRHACLSVFSK